MPTDEKHHDLELLRQEKLKEATELYQEMDRQENEYTQYRQYFEHLFRLRANEDREPSTELHWTRLSSNTTSVLEVE